MRLGQRLLENRDNAQDMLARGDFGENPAIPGVNIHLRGDNR